MRWQSWSEPQAWVFELSLNPLLATTSLRIQFSRNCAERYGYWTRPRNRGHRGAASCTAWIYLDPINRITVFKGGDQVGLIVSTLSSLGIA